MALIDHNILCVGLLFLLVSASDLSAQVHVTYEDGTSALIDDYKEDFDDLISLERYLENLEKDQRDNGLLSFSVDSVVYRSSSVDVFLYKGSSFEYDSSKAQEVDDIRAELSRLEDEGFPFAKLIVKTTLESSRISDDMVLDPGPKITMDSVVFMEGEGLPQVILSKHIGIKKGSLYSESKVKTIDRKLKSLPFIKVVRPTAVIFAQDMARVIVYAEKRGANRVDGIIGFQPDNQGKVRFTGDVKLDLHNALAHLDNLSLNWQRVADNSQNLDLGLTIPYIFQTSLGVEGLISQYRQDTTFNEIRLEGGVYSVLDRGGALKLFFFSKVVNALLNDDSFEKQGTSSVQYGLSYKLDLRDDPYNPRSGSKSDIRFSYGDKDLNTSLDGLTESRTIGQWMAHLDLKKYFSLGNRSVLLARLNGYHVNSEEVIFNELERIGGLSTLRGHDEQSIRASSFGVGTLEYRFITGERSYLNVFTDYGYVVTKTNQLNDESQYYGFGLGTALNTGSGILTLSYALGSQSNQPIILSTGKVHLGYAAIF